MNHFIHLQLPKTGDENGGIPGRYRPARCGIPNRTGCLLNKLNLGSLILRRPGITSHPSILYPSIHLQLQQTGDETGNRSRRHRSAWCGNPSSTGSSLNLNLKFVGPAGPGAVKVPYLHHESFPYIYTTPTNREENCGPLGRYRLTRCGTSNRIGCLLNPNLGFIEQAPPGEDKVPSPDQKYFPYIYHSDERRAKTMVPRADAAPHGVETPTWGSNSHRHPGSILSHPRTRNYSIHLQLQQTVDANGDPPDRYRPERCGNSNRTSCLLNPNQRFVEPAPPGEDNIPSPDQEYFRTSTTPTNRRRKRCPPGSIPLSTVWKPQPWVHKASDFL